MRTHPYKLGYLKNAIRPLMQKNHWIVVVLCQLPFYFKLSLVAWMYSPNLHNPPYFKNLELITRANVVKVFKVCIHKKSVSWFFPELTEHKIYNNGESSKRHIGLETFCKNR